MIKISRYVFLFLLILLLSTLMACSSGGSGGKTATATVSIDVQTPSQAGQRSPFLGTVDDITSITVDVLNDNTPIIVFQQLTYSNGVWSGTLENLPIGPSLTFVARAWNDSSTLIFMGTTVQTMIGYNDSVSIMLAPITSGITQTFPRITKILVPAQIMTSSTTTISISVEASSGETLTYATTAAPGGGNFNPSSGTINLSGTTATLVLSYTAPATAGTYTHSIRVINSQTNWVETNFTAVVTGTATSSLSVQFSPVITALGVRRSGSDVYFSAVVSDATPTTLTYSWGFDGGLTFADNTTNPAVLQGYDETKSGTLTLTVTNGVGGTTTVSYYIAPGLLPDNIQGIQMGGAIQGNSLSLAAAVSTLAGSPNVTGSADGTGAAARFYYPQDITTDGTNLYVADAGNCTIRKIVISTGQVTTLAGTAGSCGFADGTGPAARFQEPQAITTDGTNIYVADTFNVTIRKIVISTGQVTTLAGTAGVGGSADGIGPAASFDAIFSITTDGTNLYAADTNNSTIRKIVISTGQVTTLAGTAGSIGFADGTGSEARFQAPYGITTDGTYLYVADESNFTIRKIVISTGQVTTLAGTGDVPGSADGVGSAARFQNPEGVTTDGTSLYVVDTGNQTIRKIVISTGQVSTLAGTVFLTGSTDGVGSAARFNYPQGITTDGTNLYVADALNQTIRKLQ
jgi:hypothetical protein